ncbi:MAG TPA: hypothetical protein VMU84_07355 [Thermoanaerobaculia bacterium]|nr:hypothetical protein [Thermoanaerobaculia bacterium]
MKKQILLGTLLVGVLDIGEVVVFAGLKFGTSPMRIFQSVAAGLLGKATYDGGIKTAILGLALHFFIAFCVVLTYFLLASKVAFLRDHPLICFPIYGICVYLFMRYGVLPLTLAAPKAPPKPINLANQLFAHIFCVGLSAAWFGSRAARAWRTD